MDYIPAEGDSFIAVSRVNGSQVGPFRCRHIAHNRVIAVNKKGKSKSFQVLNWRFEPRIDTDFHGLTRSP